MGVRESLLNTITSVADSDFVRIVTSAGASSKATVRNLFKGFESNLSAKSSLTTSDYIRVVGSDNEAYKQSISDAADVIIPTTAKRFADGADASAQSVYGLYYCGSWTNAPSGAPAAGYLLVLPHGANATNYRKQIYSPYNNNDLFIRTMNGGTWSAWEQLPTRTEVDALSSKTAGTVSSEHTIDSNITWLRKVNGVVTLALGVTTTSAVGGFGSIATLPDGFKPYKQLDIKAGNYTIDITSGGGAVRVVEGCPSGTKIIFTVSFVIS